MLEFDRNARKKYRMKYKTLKGLQDILPPEIAVWQHIENKARTFSETAAIRRSGCPCWKRPIFL